MCIWFASKIMLQITAISFVYANLIYCTREDWVCKVEKLSFLFLKVHLWKGKSRHENIRFFFLKVFFLWLCFFSGFYSIVWKRVQREPFDVLIWRTLEIVQMHTKYLTMSERFLVMPCNSGNSSSGIKAKYLLMPFQNYYGCSV